MEGQRIGLGGVQHNIIIIQFRFQLSRVKYNSYLNVASFSLENGRWPQGIQIEILKLKSNVPAKPLFITVNIQRKFKTRMQKKSKEKNLGYTHCDLHHILYPSASSRPQLQNFKPAAEKYKWEQFSCAHL